MRPFKQDPNGVHFVEDISRKGPGGRTGRRIITAAMIALSAFMYVSIMVKIIKYGP